MDTLFGFIAGRGSCGGAVTVTTVTLKKEDIERTVLATGRIEARDKQEFFTPVDSTVMELAVETGDRVQRGQILGRLDTLELGRRYEEARARLADVQAALARAMATSDSLEFERAAAGYEKAQKHLERIEYLYEHGAVTAGELETARVDYAAANAAYREAKIKLEQGAAAKEAASLQAQVELAEQEVAQAEERLNLATFTAEQSGVVLFVGAEKGNRVQEGTRLLVVGSDDNLEVTAGVNEIDAGSLEEGQIVRVTCATLPGKEFRGKVSRVSAAAISQDNNGDNGVSVPVTVQLEDNTGELKLGYTVDLAIITMQKQDVLTVPFEALVDRGGQKAVFVVENGIARERLVETEPGNELNDIVVSGLNKGDRVITNPSPSIHDGLEVNIVSPGERL